MFWAHGKFCASHPWEVIIGTLTVTLCLMSMTMYSSDDKICGWNYVCPNIDKLQSPDALGVTITRCVAVMYLYFQFRDLKKMGSRYLLAISGLFTMFSSFMFSLAVVNLFKNDYTGLNEALPFFLLLIDLSKASALARFALRSTSPDEVQYNIAQGMAILGPIITLDAIVETLVIGVGTLSGWKGLETISCFGCLSVLANYLAFMTFYPACLTLVLELCREVNHGRPVWQLHQLMHKEVEEGQKLNPVIQRVKVIMSAGLMFVYAHSWWLAKNAKTDDSKEEVIIIDPTIAHKVKPEIALWQFYLSRMLNADHAITLLLAVLLGLKYIFFDVDIDTEFQKCQYASEESQTVIGDVEPNNSLDNNRNDPSSRVQFSLGDENLEQSVKMVTAATQTPPGNLPALVRLKSHQIARSTEECLEIMKSEDGAKMLTDEEILALLDQKLIPSYKLENILQDYERAVYIRRKMISQKLDNIDVMEQLPYTSFDYSTTHRVCCENVLGYVPIPLGVAGPLLLNGKNYYVPMATTEGCLVASTHRGCRALSDSGGVQSYLLQDGMTRSPVVRFACAEKAMQMKFWLEKSSSFQFVKEKFDETSRFARLDKLQVCQAGRLLYIRFIAKTGDAMGMNMLSKGAENCISALKEKFPEMEILSVSGNYCSDKKSAAVNWVQGRGKYVVSEAVVCEKVINGVLKTSAATLVDLNISKNLIGSAMAGVQGGFNAHSANIVTAVYIATGQDPAQNVSSSNCITLMETTGPNNCDLYISCSMPSLEIGTVGGGTNLHAQSTCLRMLGVQGPNTENPGNNAKTLAQIVCAAVLAGELSLMAALAEGHLVKSHMLHNRSFVQGSSQSTSHPNLVQSVSSCNTLSEDTQYQTNIKLTS